MQNIRESAVAGSFYPIDRVELSSLIKDFLDRVDSSSNNSSGNIQKIKALIVPHAGYSYSGYTAAHGYRLLKEQAVDEVFMLGASHYYPLDYVAVADYKTWKTPLGEVPQSPRLSKIVEIDDKEAINLFVKDNLPHENEHTLEVQLPFLQTVLPNDFFIVPMLIGDVSPRLVAEKLAEFLDEDDLVIASTDLSHYYPYDVAKNLDSSTIKTILNKETEMIEKPSFEACGRLAIAVLIEIIKLRNWKIKLLHYENSGDVTGDHARVVGYASFVVYE